MKNVRELETYGAILIGCGIMAYTLMLASVDAPVWATMARSRVDTCLGRVKRCFSHALIFAAQVCAIYVVILLSGLLVFWSAIFIDSKGRKFSRQ